MDAHETYVLKAIEPLDPSAAVALFVRKSDKKEVVIHVFTPRSPDVLYREQAKKLAWAKLTEMVESNQA